MKLLREVACGLISMFIGDVWLTVGILAVVLLTALLTGFGVAPPLFGGALLFLGCAAVLIASVAFYGRRHRDR
jgi:hypothetical protein